MSSRHEARRQGTGDRAAAAGISRNERGDQPEETDKMTQQREEDRSPRLDGELEDADVDAVNGGILSSGHGTNVRDDAEKYRPRDRRSLNFEEIKVT